MERLFRYLVEYNGSKGWEICYNGPSAKDARETFRAYASEYETRMTDRSVAVGRAPSAS